jgi:hypothetical protein
LELGAPWFNSLKAIGKKLSGFRKNHSAFLGKVRNYVGAHREHDAMSQLNAMAEFDALDVYRLGAELSDPVRDLAAFYIQLLKYMNNPAIIIRSIAKSLPQT